MRSKTWSSERTLFWKDVSRFWPVWGAYLAIWLIIGPIALAANVDDSGALDMYTVRSALNAVLAPGAWIFGVFGVLSAMAVFSYLYNPRSANAAASLPIRRTRQFAVHYLAGLFWLLAANLLVFLLTALVLLAYAPAYIGAAAQALAVAALSCFSFYTFAAFCATLTGNILALPFVYIIFNFVVPGVEYLVKALCVNMIYGLNLTATPITTFLSPPVALSMYTHFQDAAGTLFYVGWWYPALYAALSAGFLALAFVAYKRRRMETAGDVVAIGFLKPVFRYCMAFGCALAGAALLISLLGVSDSYPAMLIFMLIFGAAGYFGAEMLIQKSFRVFGTWPGMAAVSGILALFVVLCATDALDIESRVPDADKIADVCVYTAGEEATLREAQSVDAVRELHRRLTRHEGDALPNGSPLLPATTKVSSTSGNADDAYSFFNINIDYTLKNGFTLSRRYAYPISDALLHDDGSLAAAVNGIINCPEAVEARKTTFIPFTLENIVSAYITTADDFYVDLTAAQALEIYENGIVKDMDAGDIGRVWLWRGKDYDSEIGENGCEIYITLHQYDEEKREFTYDNFHTYVLSTSVHTRACLEKMNLLP